MKKTKINLPKIPHHKIASTPRAFDSQAVRLEASELVIPLMREFGGFDGMRYDEFTEMLKPYAKGDYDRIRLNIHSGGGDVWIGSGIYNTLVELDVPITADIPGLAASAATVVAMSADTIRIGASARFMIHNAWTVAMGNAEEMRQAADLLESIDSDIADIYSDRTGMEKSEIMDLLNAETWMNGEQAIENGFADALMPKAKDRKPQAKFKDREMHGAAADVEKWLRDKRRK